MEEVKLTKNELRDQQIKLAQLNKYLPTLLLKKAMLQIQVNDIKLEIVCLEDNLEKAADELKVHGELLSLHENLDFDSFIKTKEIHRNYENIAGVEVCFLKSVEFETFEYSVLETPIWLDKVIEMMRELRTKKIAVVVAQERKLALEKELREVSIRVNLFEKILIPRAKANIRKIKIFLGLRFS